MNTCRPFKGWAKQILMLLFLFAGIAHCKLDLAYYYCIKVLINSQETKEILIMVQASQV